MAINLSACATQLALKFANESEIPLRLRKKEKGQREKSKSNLNSFVEQRFQMKTALWLDVLEKIVSKVKNQKAMRFITISPIVESNIKSAAYCQDFIDFTDYFVLRRDIENCDDDELGLLAMLHTEFQRSIERKI